MRRTARSDHTVGGEWRSLFATHANPSHNTVAINRMSVPHLHFILASVAGSTLGPLTDPKAHKSTRPQSEYSSDHIRPVSSDPTSYVPSLKNTTP